MKDRTSSPEPLAAADAVTAPQAESLSAGSDLAPGTMVGEYRIERELGRGGMGVVYGGRQPVIGKRVAIKVLAAQLSHDPALVRRFVDEARAVNRIGHPNIIDIFAFGQLPDGRQFFVMEYLEGETLADRIDRAPLDPNEAQRLLLQVTAALEAAHRERIVHRDLKPENLWVARPKHGESFIKVLDFGIAKLIEPAASERGLTATGMVIGTPHYMAPEQCLGQPIDHAADVYALGVILYRVFAGRLPFTGSGFAEIVAQHVTAVPRRPSEHVRLPAALDALIMDCLQKEPERRPASAAEVGARLRGALADAPELSSGIRAKAPATDPPSIVFASQFARSRRRKWWAALALVLLLLALVAVALGTETLLRGGGTTETERVSPAPGVAPAPVRTPTPTPTPTPTLTPTPTPTPTPTLVPDPKRPRPPRPKPDSNGLIKENPF